MINIQAIIGVVLLVAVVIIIIKTLKHLVTAVILIVLLIVGASLIFGSLPDLSTLPVIGPVIKTLTPWIPESPGEVILKMKDVFYNLEIMSATQSSNGNIIVALVNTGKFDQSDFTAKADGEEAFLVQGPETLKPGESGIIELEKLDLPVEIFVYGKGGTSANYTLG